MESKNFGTPKTLDEAIEQAMCIGPMNEIKERVYKSVRDFVAHKIGPHVLRVDPREEKIADEFMELFREITRRPE